MKLGTMVVALFLGVLVVSAMVAALLLAPGLVDASLRPGEPRVVAGVASAETPPPAGIVVTGMGKVTGAPDIAHITVGVESTQPTAQEAQRETADKVNAVLAQIRAMGVDDKDIRTSGLSLSPVFANQGSSITGYRATNDIRITVQDISRTGSLMDAAVSAGANRGGQITTGFKDDSQMRLNALNAAVKSAQAKADAIAAAAGISVSGIDSITEQTVSTPVPLDMAPRAAAGPSANQPSPVLPGELSVTAQVTVVYRLR